MSQSAEQESVSVRMAAIFWWSWMWRWLLLSLPIVILLKAVGDTFWYADLYLGYLLTGAVAMLVVSVLAMKGALRACFGQLTQGTEAKADSISWRMTFRVFLGWTWRIAVLKMLILPPVALATFAIVAGLMSGEGRYTSLYLGAIGSVVAVGIGSFVLTVMAFKWMLPRYRPLITGQ